ncbi:hypothetical protein [Allomesorhizobium alhagi]|uniref:hypothetical protein n=1 Tax=Allomesorhizobium alhagi TaxID=475067 RepID=UPI001112180F|nr:hypothetical protein [Mesorhizobium alhagi]
MDGASKRTLNILSHPFFRRSATVGLSRHRENWFRIANRAEEATGSRIADGLAPAAIKNGSTPDGVVDLLTSLKQVAECKLIVDSGGFAYQCFFVAVACNVK